MKALFWRAASCGLWLAAALHLAGSTAWAGETSAVQIQLVVKVSDRDLAAESLVGSAEKLKGYFTRKARNAVVLRVPAAGLNTLLTEAAALGQVIDRQLRREDLGTALLQKEAALKAKTEVQGQYLALLEQAEADGALTVEKELIQLVAEIETLKGQIRHLQHRIAFAQVEVRFDYRDRPAPVPDGSSSFAWLNTMNLSDLFEEF
jgi:hypothetical protein